MPTRLVFALGVAAVAALLVFGTARVGAQEPGAAHTLSLVPSKWKKGATVSVGASRSWDLELEDEDWNDLDGGKVYLTEAWNSAVRFDGDPAPGKPGPVTLFMGSFMLSNDGNTEADQTGSGLLAEVKNGRWKKTGGNAKPSRKASTWLDNAFLPKILPHTELPWIAALQPSTPQKVGDKWEIDAAALAKGLGQFFECELDASKAKGTALLEEYNGKRKPPIATVEATLEIPLKRLPERASHLPVTFIEQPVMTWTVRGHFIQSGDIRLTSVTGEGRWNGKVKFHGKTAVMKLRISSLWSVDPGGWVPEPSQIR